MSSLSPIVSTTFEDSVRLTTTVSGASWALSATVIMLNATVPAIIRFIVVFICFGRASFPGSSARGFHFSSAGGHRWDSDFGSHQLYPTAFVNQMPLLHHPLHRPLFFSSGIVLARRLPRRQFSLRSGRPRMWTPLMLECYRLSRARHRRPQYLPCQMWDPARDVLCWKQLLLPEYASTRRGPL